MSGYRDCKGNRQDTWTLGNAEQSKRKTANIETGTWDSINTFYAALEQKVGLCNAVKMAEKFGMTQANGQRLLQYPSQVLGTNNIGRNTNEDIAAGDRAIIQEFRKQQPQAKILVLGVFPRGAQGGTPMRANIAEINSHLAKLADNKNVFYMDIGPAFLTPDGTLTTEVMADGLHPTTKGYAMWAAAINDKVRELMR